MCVNAIRANEPNENFSVIAVLDGAVDPPEGINSIPGVQPFCFSRNMNAGIEVAKDLNCDGVILLNHDAQLLTLGGFTSLVQTAGWNLEYGVISSAVRGLSCNGFQDVKRNFGTKLIETDVTVAFICVYIPRKVLDLIGPLDERLTGYGYDDDLYCTQVRAAGLKVGVWHGCVVDHESLPSSFRTKPDINAKMMYNHSLYHQIVDQLGLVTHSTHHRWCHAG